MRTGISPSPYINYYGRERGIERIAAHGYDCLDAQLFCNTETELFQVSEAEFEKRLRADRELAESFGLTYSQSHGPWRCPTRDGTEEERAERFEKMSRSIRGTAYVGAKSFVIHCMMPYGPRSGEDREGQLELNREYFGRLLRVAEEYQVVIALENLPFPLLPLSDAADVLRFVREMNSPWMRMCLDTGHCSFGADTAADAVRLIGKDYLAAMHVHDNDGKRDLHLEVGSGIVDWTDFSRALREIDFDGVVSLETAVPDDVTDPAERDARERALFASARKLADGADS